MPKFKVHVEVTREFDGNIEAANLIDACAMARDECRVHGYEVDWIERVKEVVNDAN